MTSHKVCTKCGEQKPATTEFFDYKPANKSGLANECKECRKKLRRERYANEKEAENARSRAWYHNNKSKARDINKTHQQSAKGKHSNRIRYMKRMYGLTETEYQDIMDKQMGACAICSTALYDECKDRRPSVDHCHDTGRVRGLLCSNCNVGLGQFMDSPELVLNAYNYLKEN